MKKKVLITGVARGIGRSIAERFLQAGYIVHGTYCSSKKQAKELQEEYGKENIILHGEYDFCDLNQTKILIEEVSNIKFDVIVSNAGMFSENNDFDNFDINVFSKTMNCNFYTTLMLCTCLQNNINENGSIIVVSSNDAFPGAYSSISYTVSKAALISLTRCLAVNFGKKHVRVNSVAPGAINTDMNTEEQMKIAPYFTPLGSVGEPNDVAKVVYFLASENASFISGENITIDGGYNINSILLKSEADKALSDNMQKFIEEQMR